MNFYLRHPLWFATFVGVSSVVFAASANAKDKEQPRTVRPERVAKLASELVVPDFVRHSAAYSELKLLAQSSASDASSALSVIQEFDRRAEKWALTHGHKTGKPSFSITKKAPPDSMPLIYLAERTHSLQIVGMAGDHITDEHVSYLSGLEDVTILDINQAAVTGTTLVHANLPSLRVLHLGGCPITDASALRMTFPKLTVLDLSNTLISDEFIKGTSLTKIRELWLHGTQVTSDGIHLLPRLPELRLLTADLKDIQTGTVEVINKLPKMSRLRLAAPGDSKEALLIIRRQLDQRIGLYVRENDGKWSRVEPEDR